MSKIPLLVATTLLVVGCNTETPKCKSNTYAEGVCTNMPMMYVETESEEYRVLSYIVLDDYIEFSSEKCHSDMLLVSR